jgi:3-phosphoshikimate 1-carboxyvinyltransferase
MAVPLRAPPVAIASGRPFRGRFAPPPSKSVTNRVLVLALLAGRRLVVENPLLAEDTRHLLTALAVLGWRVEPPSGAPAGGLEIEPGPWPAAARLECGASGSMARFLAAALTTLPGRWLLDGGARLRERPLGPLVAALRALGATIRELGAPGRLPLEIEGGSLVGGRVELDAGESSQYLSALLMAAPRANRTVEIRVSRLASAPYAELTVEMLRRFGVAVERRGALHFRVQPGLPGVATLRIEADWSAACYPAAAAALSRGRAELLGLDPGSAQPDRRFLELLGGMGAAVAWTAGGGLVVERRGDLLGLDADLAELPDQAPTLAVLAPFARGVTRIRNIGHLRLKESDRLAAVASELRRCGAEVRPLEDGLEIPGCWAAAAPPDGEVLIETHGDHRIAMSFAVLGLARPGLRIAAPRVVAKSYPEFWSDFASALDP